MSLPSRAAEFRDRAAAEATAGAASPLAQVRAKHEQAAQVWAELAKAEEARAEERAARRAESARIREASSSGE